MAKSPLRESSPKEAHASTSSRRAGAEGGRSAPGQVPTLAPSLAALLAWAIPGAGHFALGRRGRAVLFFVLVIVSVWLGLELHGHLHTEIGDPLKTLGTVACAGLGVVYGIVRFVLGYQGDVTSVGYEYGTTFLMTAGLMNLLLVLDAWDIARGTKE